MMEDPTPKESESSKTEEIYEWGLIDGKLTKITSKNANGRRCSGCNHDCPCKCECCKPYCCSSKGRKK